MVTYNEEENLGQALESARDADEIVVVDAFSTDRTVEIARAYTERVYQQHWRGFSVQKQSAIDHAEGEWILLLDADERLTAELREEIREAINGTGKDGFYLPRKNYFLGRWIRHGGWWPDLTLRLFRNGRGAVKAREVHERIEVDGPVGRLKNPLLHYTYHSLEQFIRKMNNYSTLSAREMASAGKTFNLKGLLLNPPATFFRMYLLRQGFRDGLHGLVLAILYSYYSFLKYAKLWEDECT